MYLCAMPFAANLNGQLLDQLPEALALAQRAVFYGDALFETMRVSEGRIPLLERHLVRLFAGLTALGFAVPPDWSAGFFQKEIRCTAPPNARVRLTVWRSPGGRYAPADNTPQFLITAEPLDSPYPNWLEPGLELGLCTTVRLPVDAFSNLKTLNAARYVAAAREARDKGWNDAVLLNAHDRVCEATSSNVFWWEGDRLCTVLLLEGCVAGVFRAAVLETACSAGIPVAEKTACPEVLHAANEIFLTNAARGIMPVRIFAGRNYSSSRTRHLFDLIRHAFWPTAENQ
ncbi:MAG: aminotransferase class IV [Lewinellaceae bacterium]|nr:aminotransferase class IV [Lewinellaceae bacterium]